MPYGAGCAGPLGVPRLRAVGTPSLGAQRFELETSAAPSGSAVVFVLGPTAIDLSFGGGCRMLAGTPWATATVLAGVDDRARLALPVPTSTALRGLRLYAQSFVFSRGGAWNGGLAFSDGLGLLIER